MKTTHTDVIFMEMIHAIFIDRRDLFLEKMHELLSRMTDGELMPVSRCFYTELICDYIMAVESTKTGRDPESPVGEALSSYSRGVAIEMLMNSHGSKN